MSYILDALKRAEAERSRGEIPGLHAQPAGLTPGDVGPSAKGSVFFGALMAAVVVLGLAWWWLSDDAPAPPTSVLPALPAFAPVPVAPVPSEAPTPVASTPVTAPNPTPPAIRAEVVPPTVVAAPAATRAPPKAVVKPVANPQPRRQAAPVAGAASEPAGSAESRVLALSELPIEIRGALPPLVVGGASHSEHAASRMLILNGQIYHEGDRLTGELTLQQIQLRSAVLSFRGHRFSISY